MCWNLIRMRGFVFESRGLTLILMGQLLEAQLVLLSFETTDLLWQMQVTLVV